MKIVHIESGLGNQMLSYCEYLALKKMNPADDIYIENIIYDLPDCNNVICQWNGYELDRIFGISAPNIRVLFDTNTWCSLLSEIENTRFWEKNWNYPVHFTNVLREFGIHVENFRGDFESKNATLMTGESKSLKSKLRHTCVGYFVKTFLDYLGRKKHMESCCQANELFYCGDDSIFTGQRLSFKYIGNNIEALEDDIRTVFQFPPITDDKNQAFIKYLNSHEAVAIHARRGDMLGYNADFYKYGYFKRAVAYIRKHTTNPVFVFFCDPGSIDWCKNNGRIFGLNFKKDTVLFVDWNKGPDSFRDMQLMATCKHQIITNSSFGWWAAFLNNNPEKITCSPGFFINTTHHFI